MAEYKLSYTASEIDEALGRKPIIDVLALPETDIKEDCWYRLHKPVMTYNGYIRNDNIYVVNSLPDAGVCMQDGNKMILYYNLQTQSLHGYADAELASDLGMSSGWYSFEQIVDVISQIYEQQQAYGGTITSFDQATESNTYYLLVNNYVLYEYKNKWNTLNNIGMAGAGTNAETFNCFMNVASGDMSHAEGQKTTASGGASHAEGVGTKASGNGSHAEGYGTTASGIASHAEGYMTQATADAARAEGRETVASGLYSHAEGIQTTASANCAHSEGQGTTASGLRSHAEGYKTTASGVISHAEGFGTIANSATQHVEGMYNIEDVPDEEDYFGTYVHIIGNGSSSERSNAHTVDWDGNAWYAGDVYVGSTSGTNKDSGSKKLATEEFVTNAVASAGGSGSGTGITVDSEFSLTSTNPLQNKVVAEAFQNVQSEFETMQNEIDNLSAGGGAGGGSNAIIDVGSLPTENINEDNFYRLVTGTFVYNQYLQTQWTCYCVDSLPEVGEAAFTGDLSDASSIIVTAYHNTTDNTTNVYLTEDLATQFGMATGWCPIADVMALTGYAFNGVIYDISEDPKDSTFRLLLKYEMHSYKNKWTTVGAGAMPEVTSNDNGKILMVVDGQWAATTIENGDEVAY